MSNAKHLVAKLLSGVPPFSYVTESLRRGGAPIFMFHRVLPEAEPCYDSEMATSTMLFAAFLDWVREHYRVMEVSELLRTKPKSGKMPPCAITFDDGWRDVYMNAFPLLKERQMPATIYLPVRFVGTKRRFWQDRLWKFLRDPVKIAPMETKLRRAVLRFPWCPPLGGEILDLRPLRRLLLSRSSLEAEQFVDRLEEMAGIDPSPVERTFVNWEEVRAMQADGITFGSHTLHHTLLTHSDPLTAEGEVRNSRGELQDAIGGPPVGFSYPWGAADCRIRECVAKAGYSYAVTTQTRLVQEAGDDFLAPRLAISSAFLIGEKSTLSPRRLKFYLARAAVGLSGQTRKVPKGSSGARRLRIGFVIDAIDSWESGGTERQLRTLIEALDPKYFEPELFFLRPSTNLRAEELPCPVYVAGQGRSRLGMIRGLIRDLRRRRPDVVQCFFRDGTYYGTVAAFLGRVPVRVSGRRNAGHWITTRDRLALPFINRLTTAWQCNSRAAFESLRSGEAIPGNKIEILPNAVNLSKFSAPDPAERTALRGKMEISPSALTLVSVANLTSVKDPLVIVEAAAGVCAQIPEATFLIVGEGPLRGELESRIKELGLTASVRLCGAQSDVRPFLAVADIGLLTSRSEGSSNSVLEYMAMQLPSVLSDIPANHEFVDGMFFEVGNSRDLSRKILELWNNKDLGSALRRQYRLQAAEFGLEALGRRAQTFYTKCVAEAASK